MSLLLEQRKTSPVIGIAIGLAGIGKTVALSCFQHTLAWEMPSPQPNLVLTASPFLTPSRLASQLLQSLDASTYPSIHDTGHSLSAMLRQQEIHLLLIDNADLLKTETWEMLRMLSDETPCPLLLVGHPVLLDHLKQHPYLIDRVRLALELHPVSFDEVLHVVLPNLAGDRWVFHPDEDGGQCLAAELWSPVTPSLCQLRNILDTASTLARIQHKSTITPACLSQALQWIPRSPVQEHIEGEKMVHISTKRTAKKERRAERKAERTLL